MAEEFSGSFFTFDNMDSLGGVGRVAGAKFSMQFGEVVRRLLMDWGYDGKLPLYAAAKAAAPKSRPPNSLLGSLLEDVEAFKW